MTQHHYFWGKEKPSQFDPEYERNASRMYLKGDRVYLESEMFDREDHRCYENSGWFDRTAYQQALTELDEVGQTKIVNEQGGCTLSLEQTEQERVRVTLGGRTGPSTTPGGASLSSATVFSVTRDQLQLPQ